MNETLDLAALAQELQALEIDTFKIGEYLETDLLAVIPIQVGLCSTTSSTTSTTSTCS